MRSVLLHSAAAVLALVSLGPGAAGAQTADDFFNDQILQRVDLWVNSRDWKQLVANYTLNDHYPATMKWNNVTVRNVGIRSRGTGSRFQTKLGLRVVFDHYTTGGRFLGMQSLVLKNMVQDPSLIHEPTAMKFLRAMGIPAPRESFAMLYVNNAYYGLYALVEEYTPTSLARFVGESSGYLFEYRWNYDYHFEYMGSDLARYQTLFEAKTHETEPLETLYRPLETWVRLMTEEWDDYFVGTMNIYVDLSLFVRHMAVENFVAEWDGILGYAGLNNFQLYRFAGKTMHQVLPWDKDNTFRAIDYAITQGHDADVMMRRAMLVPEYRQLYYDTLIACADLADQQAEGVTGGPGWLEREVTREIALVSAAAKADPNVKADEFTAATDYMVQFAQQRSAFVRSEVAKARGQ
jgi:spore coat protein CotH